MKTANTNDTRRLQQSARWLFTTLAFLTAFMATAQENRLDKSPDNKFPQNLPATARYDVSRPALDQLFRTDGSVNVSLSAALQMKGNIENKDLDAAGNGTILIRTESFDGAMLSLARYTDTDQSVHYSGHLLKLHAAEGMLLVEKDQNYYFIRTQQRYLLAE